MADDSDALDRQLTRGFLHLHTRLSESFANLFEATGAALAIADHLVSAGIVTEAELNARVADVKRRLAETRFGRGPAFVLDADTGDKYDASVAVEIDCGARLAQCRAACCALSVPLSRDDVAEGILRWDAGEPYLLRRGAGAHCVHLDGDARCGVREHRPLACRRYSCRNDARIWTDFEGRIPNDPGIDAILAARESRPRRLD